MKKTNTIFTKLHADLLRFISKSLPNKTSRYDAFMYLLENQIELINQYKTAQMRPDITRFLASLTNGNGTEKPSCLS